MPCPRCQHENPRGQKFCGACGTPLTANPSGPPAPSYAEITSALSEALEQQTATAEILRVISSSPTDVQPVFAAVLRSAARLCDAFDATIFQVDGDGLRLVAHEGPIPSIPVGAFPLRGTAAGRAVLDRRTIHVPDVQAEVDEYPESSALRGPTVSGQRSAFLCSAGPRPSGRSPSGGPRYGRSPTGRSSSWRPSPPRRSSPSRTSACSTRRKEALEQQTATARSCG